MQAQNNLAGEMTEKIMNRLAGRLNPNPVFKDLDTATYNRMWSEVNALLTKYVGHLPATIDQSSMTAVLGSLLVDTKRA